MYINYKEYFVQLLKRTLISVLFCVLFLSQPFSYGFISKENESSTFNAQSYHLHTHRFWTEYGDNYECVDQSSVK